MIPLGVATEDQLRREREKFRSIQSVARAVGSMLELDRVLHLIVDKVTELMAADRATLYVVDQERRELWTKILRATELKEIRLQIGEGIAGWVAQCGETVNIADAYTDDRFAPETDQRSGYRTRSILCTPMKNPYGRIIGVVQVLNKHQGPFTHEDEELLEALASQAGIAVENSQLYLNVVRQNRELVDTHLALQRRMRELDLLLEVQEQVNDAMGLDELLSGLLEKVCEQANVEAAGILLRNKDLADVLHFLDRRVDADASVTRFRVKSGEGIVGWVADHGEGVLIDRPLDDPRFGTEMSNRLGMVPRNMVCVPLVAQNVVVGALEVVNRRGRDRFDDDDLRLTTLIGGRIAQVIELARYKEQRIREGRLASIGQMLSSLVHDLRTPMTVISGYAQLMAESDDAEERSGCVESIQRQFDIMSEMTREVLAFARGESNLLVRKVYVAKFLREIEQNLRRGLSDQAIDLELTIDYTGVAYFDESKVRRAIHNICRNAAEAMSAGGTLKVMATSNGDDLVLQISDTGSGIPAELEGRLFEAFATSGKEQGTGLGLAIAKKIIDDHDGSISYRSQNGEGTEFTITLPRKRVVPSSSQVAVASA